MFGQNSRNDVVQLGDEGEERIFGQVLESEFTLGHVTRIGLTEHGVAETGNNLTTVQSVPQVLGDLFVRGVLTNGFLHLHGPAQDFLVGKTVEGTSQGVKTTSEGEIRISKSGTDQVSAANKKKKKVNDFGSPALIPMSLFVGVGGTRSNN
jgi:hypothetical protein